MAQEPAGATRRVVAHERFAKSGLYRLLFGDNYRDLWTTPVELPVLDLASHGGLTALRRVGGRETRALAFEGGDGRAYTFRPLSKDPVLPPELGGGVATRFVRDQFSSQHPAGQLIVAGLAAALGLLHNDPVLVVMPDDAALGEFREDFKGLVGDFEEFTGQAGFSGASEIIEGAALWERLDASPATRVDSRAFLAARLLDHLVGDWDRHRDQWRWAKLPDSELLQPIGEDRDQAFARFSGAVLAVMRPGLPLLVKFGDEYPSLDGLTFDSWDADRRLLADLERLDFEDVARTVQQRLTDDVIGEAVRRMPPEWFAKVGATTIASLEKRRDALPAHATAFYRFLARQVDVRASEQDDVVEIERFEQGDVEVRVALAASPAVPYYRRRFRRGETEEVRLYVLSGDDRIVTRGARGGITVRVVGGAGEDAVDDSAVGGLRVSDEGLGGLRPGPGTGLDAKPYEAPPPGPRGDWVPARDWGRRNVFPLIRLTGNTDFGLVVSAGFRSTAYGFRKYPFADEHTLRLSVATRLGELRGEYEGRFRFENSRRAAVLKARASGFELVHFYGFGNETTTTRPDQDYRIHQDLVSLAPALSLDMGKRWSASIGLAVERFVTEAEPDSALAELSPRGIETTTQFGGMAGLALDTTDRQGLPTKGVRLALGGSAFPATAGLEKAFGEVHGQATAFLTAGATLALRAAGKRIFGDYPYYEAVFLGGVNTLRGLQEQRYAGDAGIAGGAELYVPFGKAFLFVPGGVGLMGLFDVGRVYLDGEESKRWHKGYGGGFFYASPKRNHLVVLSVARSEGRTGVYLKTGLGFQ